MFCSVGYPVERAELFQELSSVPRNLYLEKEACINAYWHGYRVEPLNMQDFVN